MELSLKGMERNLLTCAGGWSAAGQQQLVLRDEEGNRPLEARR